MRRKQPNLSYFAFTATPTSRTLNLFGRFDPARPNPDQPGETGMNVPFHVYSMRQAIEEGYILDVLANYITYDLKWRLRNLAVEQQESLSANPEVDERKAKRELVKFAVRHPTSVDQRAKLIVDDFRDNVDRRLGGRAKAMVVTSSRQDALGHIPGDPDVRGRPSATGRWWRSPGRSSRRPVITVTEAQLNGFSEGQLPKMFDYTRADDPHAATSGKREYRLLVAAEKYQTGFDQPLLCAMYVDKPLTGVAAVQTLSRLNRIHPLKSQDDVRVLDFVNSADDIQASFKPWFDTTIAKPEDPNLLYDKQREVMAYAVLAVPEMEAFVRVLTEGRARTAAGRGGAGAARAAARVPAARASTGSPPWRATTSGRSSARRCATTRGRTRSSRRSSTGAIRTSNGSTSTGGCCCCACRGGPLHRWTSATLTCRTSGLSSPGRTTCRCLPRVRTAWCAGTRPAETASVSLRSSTWRR